MRLPPTWSLDLPDSIAALRERNAFVAYLRRYGRADDDYGAAELIYGELVANVLLHAPGPIEVQAEWSAGRATLHVTDEGLPFDLEAHRREPDPFSEHGRGLAIVSKLSPRVVEAISPGCGKTVSAELPVHPRVGPN